MNAKILLCFFLLGAGMARAAVVNYVQTSVNDANGSIISAVASNQWLETAVEYSTVTAPALFSGYSFVQWSNNREPTETYRDAWGRSENPVTFVLLEDTILTAHYLPSTHDADADGVSDWFELEYYGALTNGAASDTDADGLSLLQEFAGGTHPLYGNATQAGGVYYADSSMVTVDLAGYPRYTLRSEPSGTVDESALAEPGTEISTPDLSGNASFGYWELDGVRQVDIWGVAVPQVTFTVTTNDREAVAYIFSGDSDGDGVADAWEEYYLGTLTNAGASDADGDGLSLIAEYGAGTHPLYANSNQAGGVFYADSELISVNLAGFSRYTLSSDPAGVVDESSTVTNGTVITTPAMNQATFGYWTLDGDRQADAWGVACRQLAFTITTNDREVVAHFFADDSDGDGVNDGFEQYYYGSLTNDAASDTDGDGQTLLTESAKGENPLFGNSTSPGGVFYADSQRIVVNLQAFERAEYELVEGAHTNFYTRWPTNLTGVSFGTYTTPALGDWDDDGDLDLFVGSETGRMTIYENCGSVTVPHLTDVSDHFADLATAWNGVRRPSPALEDWNGDGAYDLALGSEQSEVRIMASSGHFNEGQTTTVNYTLDIGSASNHPALLDVTADGYPDLLVLKADGLISVYTNTQDALLPFAGAPWTTDWLGEAIIGGCGLTVTDVNGDELMDVLASDVDGRIWEFWNTGSGYRLQSKVYGGTYDGFADTLTIAAGDWDGDGDADVMCGFAEGGLMLLRNKEAHLWVTPNLVTLLAGESQEFSVEGYANTEVTWQLLQNESGGSIGSNGVYVAGVASGVDIVLACRGEGYGRAYVNVKAVLPAFNMKSIVIAGRKGPHDSLWPVTDYLGGFAYESMRYLGYRRGDVQYLSAVPDQDVDGNGELDDIDGLSSWTNVCETFTNWVSGCDDLFIYLVDHGSTNASGEGVFHLREGETLDAVELDTWLDALQDECGADVSVVLDFCYASAFAEQLDYDGAARRSVYASCGSDEATYFMAGGLVSFSDAFISALLLGLDYEDSFDLAFDAVARYQHPQEFGDDAGDCYPGDGPVMGRNIPMIGEVCPNQTLNGTSSVELWADQVGGVYEIARVWCLVVPPTHVFDPANPVMDVPSVELTPDGTGRYAGTHDGFSEDGVYKVVFYAQDIWGGVSLPRQMYVTQDGFNEHAVIVLGEIDGPVRELAGRFMAWTAWKTMQARHIPLEHIYLLADEGTLDLDLDGHNDAADACTPDALHALFTNELASCDKVTVCLFGEAQDGAFRMNDSETLPAATLDQWLDDYQVSNSPVVAILDFNGAGTYLSSMVGPETAERIVISSTGKAQTSLWAFGGRMSFSYFFWGSIFGGDSIGGAFDTASDTIFSGSGHARQHPMLDDDGNGIANPPTDGLLAAQRYIGSAFMTGGDSPVIGTVLNGATCTETNITLWVNNVTDMHGISSVWCSITAPWYEGEGDPDCVALTWNTASNRYEGLASGLTWTGEYVVTYFAEDVDGETAVPVQGTFSVVQLDADGDGLPDCWEQLYFAGDTNAQPNLDTDGDGFSNYQEWRAGSDPHDRNSCFECSAVNPPHGAFVLQWPSIPNRTYSIYATTNLLEGFHLLTNRVRSAQNGVTVFTNDASQNRSMYYRIMVE